MILQRTPEQMIWGYHEPLLEAAALLDDSLTFTSFGFFTKVMKLEMRCKFEFSFLGGNILHFGDFAVWEFFSTVDKKILEKLYFYLGFFFNLLFCIKKKSPKLNFSCQKVSVQSFQYPYGIGKMSTLW